MATMRREDSRICDGVRGSKIQWDSLSKHDPNSSSFISGWTRGSGLQMHHTEYDDHRAGRVFPRSTTTAGDHRRSTVLESNRRWVRSYLPTFSGSNMKDLLKWIEAVEFFFNDFQPPENLKCKLAYYAFEGEVEEWWRQLQHQRLLEGEPEIQLWPWMKFLLLSHIRPAMCSTKCLSKQKDMYCSSEVDESSKGRADRFVPTTCLTEVPNESYISKHEELEVVICGPDEGDYLVTEEIEKYDDIEDDDTMYEGLALLFKSEIESGEQWKPIAVENHMTTNCLIGSPSDAMISNDKIGAEHEAAKATVTLNIGSEACGVSDSVKERLDLGCKLGGIKTIIPNPLVSNLVKQCISQAVGIGNESGGATIVVSFQGQPQCEFEFMIDENLFRNFDPGGNLLSQKRVNHLFLHYYMLFRNEMEKASVIFNNAQLESETSMPTHVIRKAFVYALSVSKGSRDVNVDMDVINPYVEPMVEVNETSVQLGEILRMRYNGEAATDKLERIFVALKSATSLQIVEQGQTVALRGKAQPIDSFVGGVMVLVFDPGVYWSINHVQDQLFFPSDFCFEVRNELLYDQKKDILDLILLKGAFTCSVLEFVSFLFDPGGVRCLSIQGNFVVIQYMDRMKEWSTSIAEMLSLRRWCMEKVDGGGIYTKVAGYTTEMLELIIEDTKTGTHFSWVYDNGYRRHIGLAFVGGGEASLVQVMIEQELLLTSSVAEPSLGCLEEATTVAFDVFGNEMVKHNTPSLLHYMECPVGLFPNVKCDASFDTEFGELHSKGGTQISSFIWTASGFHSFRSKVNRILLQCSGSKLHVGPSLFPEITTSKGARGFGTDTCLDIAAEIVGQWIQEEIFGPIMPMMEYSTNEREVRWLQIIFSNDSIHLDTDLNLTRGRVILWAGWSDAYLSYRDRKFIMVKLSVDTFTLRLRLFFKLVNGLDPPKMSYGFARGRAFFYLGGWNDVETSCYVLGFWSINSFMGF